MRAIDEIAEALSRLLGTEPTLVPPRPAHRGRADLCVPTFPLARERGEDPARFAKRAAEALGKEGLASVGAAFADGGFLNLRLSDEALWGVVEDVLRADGGFARCSALAGRRVNCEYVSANPTGPLNVVSARAASVGDALCNLLRWCGADVTSEFYVNDVGAQVEALGESVAFKAGLAERLPEGGYAGDYVALVARAASERGVEREALGAFAVDFLLGEQMRSLERFGTRMDVVSRESEVVGEERRKELLDALDGKGLTYVQDGALFFRSSRFGDEKDRVLVRSDRRPTYFADDLVYHLDKVRRGADCIVDILGPDHHGYVARLRAGLAAMGFTGFEVLIVGQVTLTSEGKEVSMSKRAGEIVTLDALVAEVGVDASRFFSLARAPSSPLPFDLALAKTASVENPVYYLQYAHARVESLMRHARVAPCARGAFDSAEARAVARELLYFPLAVLDAATHRAPQTLVSYLLGLAGAFHAWYQAHRIIADDEGSPGRLALARAVGLVVREGLGLLNVGAPERM